MRMDEFCVLGWNPDRAPVPIHHAVGVMPEKAWFYDWMTGTRYLKWFNRLYDSPSTDRDLEMVLAKVGLGAEARRPNLL
jgi:ABC-2 type transport system ATP-binding protein